MRFMTTCFNCEKRTGSVNQFGVCNDCQERADAETKLLTHRSSSIEEKIALACLEAMNFDTTLESVYLEDVPRLIEVITPILNRSNGLIKSTTEISELGAAIKVTTTELTEKGKKLLSTKADKLSSSW